MSQAISLNMLLEAMPKPISKNATIVHHRSKKKGSILDLYKNEIIHLKDIHHCSYSEILHWLNTKHNVIISKTALHNRIQYWKDLVIDE
ncbi:TPA: hypothetical protein KDZ68_003424 [Vibrio parahaemolyticus]|nr:hypothetical protein [Vibrio parahaemolyticus]